jgi:uncharacterized protein (TIGR03067 family)
MKTLRNILVCLAFMTIAIGQAQSDEAKIDLAKLQGEWVMVSGSRDGQMLATNVVANSRRVAKGNEMTVTIDGQLLMQATFTLDPSKKPKAIDYAMKHGPHMGQTELGIYEIDGDTIKFCFAIPGEPRPIDFTTKTGDKRTSSTWKPAKPSGDKK